MRIVEENETEIYIELEDKDLPYTQMASGKKVYVRFKQEEPVFDIPMKRLWIEREEALKHWPNKHG